MPTILSLDIGNTSVDACVFDGGKLEYLGKFPHEELESLIKGYDHILVSSVKPSLNYKLSKAHIFKPEEVPVKVSFDGKEKVGIDRLLNIYGALEFYSDWAVVVSCGTALVLDVLVDGVFEGGFITLGIGARLRALYERAELIPKLDLEKVEVFLGKDTKGAILGGLRKEVLYYVNGVISELEEFYERHFKVVITGGDGWFLEELGEYDPLLIHRAMLRLKRLL
ncbi:type III pantothenate kinase [Thermocrinis sp.]